MCVRFVLHHRPFFWRSAALLQTFPSTFLALVPYCCSAVSQRLKALLGWTAPGGTILLFPVALMFLWSCVRWQLWWLCYQTFAQWGSWFLTSLVLQKHSGEYANWTWGCCEDYSIVYNKKWDCLPCSQGICNLLRYHQISFWDVSPRLYLSLAWHFVII